jgi:hypothetical protein
MATRAIDEAALWERLSQSRRVPLEPDWLGEAYSPGLSSALCSAISEQLGMLGPRGWPVIEALIRRHGNRPDLVHAAGLCHQAPARDWLLSQLREKDSDAECPDLPLLEALSCWGAELTLTELERILEAAPQATRLAGLELLRFKAHQLNAHTLLQLCAPALADWRDRVTIAAIRLLQRRDEPCISDALAGLCRTGSDTAAAAALKALGCMATPRSQELLGTLVVELSRPQRRDLAMRQLQQQFRNR